MRRHILVVEDNPDDADLTVSALREAGVDAEIGVAEDGVDALEYLTCTGRHAGRMAGTPDVILLDLKLPRMSGLQLLTRLRADQRTRRTPVVVLTSSTEETDRIRSYDLGANSYVRKPVDYDEFLEVAKTLTRYWLDINEPPPLETR